VALPNSVPTANPAAPAMMASLALACAGAEKAVAAMARAAAAATVFMKVILGSPAHLLR
jgi:hypothetical protein